MTAVLPRRSQGVAISGMLLCGLIAMLGGYFALGQSMRVRSASAASAGFSFDTQTQVNVAEQRLTAATTPANARSAEQVARAALHDEPLNSRALRLLGHVAATGGSDRKALVFFDLSERVSRRDLTTQIVLLEAAVARGSVDQALNHYDRALRTHPTSSSLLFPVLTGALDDPVIRKSLRPYVHPQTPWIVTFVNFAALEASRTAAAADLLLESAGADNRSVVNQVGPSLLVRLVERGEYGRARGILYSMGGAPAILRDARWTSASTDPRFSALAWTPTDTPEVSARFDLRGDPALSLYAAPGQSGVALSKLLNLGPGRYALTQETRLANRENDSALTWQVTCIGRNDAIWKSVDLSVQRRYRGSGPTIDSGCRLQRLELVAAGGTGQVGLDATLSNFRLIRQ